MKEKLYKIFYLSIGLSVFVVAGALEKYTIPQQSIRPYIESATPPQITSSPQNIFTQFESKISNLSQRERDALKANYVMKRDAAAKNNQFDAVGYYQRFIDILKKYEGR
jgi:hypothetical protein